MAVFDYMIACFVALCVAICIASALHPALLCMLHHVMYSLMNLHVMLWLHVFLLCSGCRSLLILLQQSVLCCLLHYVLHLPTSLSFSPFSFPLHFYSVGRCWFPNASSPSQLAVLAHLLCGRRMFSCHVPAGLFRLFLNSPGFSTALCITLILIAFFLALHNMFYTAICIAFGWRVLHRILHCLRFFNALLCSSSNFVFCARCRWTSCCCVLTFCDARMLAQGFSSKVLLSERCWTKNANDLNHLSHIA